MHANRLLAAAALLLLGYGSINPSRRRPGLLAALRQSMARARARRPLHLPADILSLPDYLLDDVGISRYDMLNRPRSQHMRVIRRALRRRLSYERRQSLQPASLFYLRHSIG